MFCRKNEFTGEVEMFDPFSIFTSPSCLYASKYSDRVKVDGHSVSVILQCRQKPGSYRRGQSTMKGNERIDQWIGNDRIEFYTKRNLDIVVTGLLIKIRDYDFEAQTAQFQQSEEDVDETETETQKDSEMETETEATVEKDEETETDTETSETAEPCWKCRGSGQVSLGKCVKCRGSGQCRVCQRSGIASRKSVVCKRCKGSGNDGDCSECGGSGVCKHIVIECRVCQGTVKCAECDGSGLFHRDCFVCRGDGTL